MAFASPSASSRSILNVSDTGTSGSVSYPFTIPQDTDTIVAKFWTGSQFPGALAGSAQVWVQTSEDGGTTYRDCAYWTVTSVITNANAHFQALGAIGDQRQGVAQWTGSVTAANTWVTSVASAAVGTATGMPIVGTYGRVYITYGGTVASNTGINVQLFAPTTNSRA